MKTVIVAMLALACLARNALATETEVAAFTVSTLEAEGVTVNGHPPGSFEVTGNFRLIGVNCDPTYVTTRSESDPDHAIFSTLKIAAERKIPVSMRVTDAVQAFPGHCSIVAVGFPAPAPVSPGNPGGDSGDSTDCGWHPEKPNCQP